MLLLVCGATGHQRSETVGDLIVPKQWNDPKSIPLYPGRWAMDNGAYLGAFDEGAFVRMLYACHPYHADQGYHGCLFVAAPDVVADAASTRARWPFWSRLIRGLGYQAAFIAQDGIQPHQIPWDELGAIFIGGTTEYKESAAASSLMAYARARGVHVHVGRVNGKRRFEMMLRSGCDSIDGTGFSIAPNINIPKVDGEWRTEIEEQPHLTGFHNLI